MQEGLLEGGAADLEVRQRARAGPLVHAVVEQPLLLARLGVSSGPSGAATLAGLRAVLGDPDRRTALGLGPDAVVVLLSTEGGDR